MKKQYFLLSAVVMLLVSTAFAEKAAEKVFTLSDADLMSLDCYADRNDPNYNAAVVDKRDIPGPGVEFDIHFPDNSEQHASVRYVSSKYCGEGELVGIDVNDYDAFSLKFTIVSVDGNSSPDSGGLLIVGALISNRHNSMTYSTNVISLMRDHKTSVVSSTPVDIDKISVIGVAIYEMDPIGWNPEGTTVTLRIEAAPRAEVLP